MSLRSSRGLGAGPRTAARRARALAALALLALAACDGAPDKPDKSPPPRPPAPPSASAAAPGSAAPLPTATASARAEAGAAGSWEGSYDAKKGVVSLPPKVKDKALAADDGKRASGPGTVELTISDGGEVRGRIKGALGAGTVNGRVDEGMVRASIAPEDARAEGAMFGVLVGSLKGDVLKAEIHVAGPDATVVREATFELKRK